MENGTMNAALYWKCFAYLAANGQLTDQDWRNACFAHSVSGVSNEAVKAIQETATMFRESTKVNVG